MNYLPTYRLKFQVSPHSELHILAHDINPFISTDDGTAIPFDEKITGEITCDLKTNNQIGE